MVAIKKHPLLIYSLNSPSTSTYSKIAYIMTTSINGKSIQYSKLKCLKYIGLTEGYGTGHILDDIINDCKTFVIQKFPKYNIKKMSKHTILNLVIKTLHLNPLIIYCNMIKNVEFTLD